MLQITKEMSVSDIVNTCAYLDDEFCPRKYWRDLWDEVLTECGYDPTAVHGQFQELVEFFDSEEVSDGEKEVSDGEEEVSDTDEQESMIEE